MRRADVILTVVALVSGLMFFANVGRLWPLADADLFASLANLRPAAEAVLARQGLDLASYRAARRLRVDDGALTYVETAFGRDRAQGLIRAGLPLVYYRLTFKQADEPDAVTVAILGDGRLLGWDKSVQEDAAGGRLEADAAERAALAAITDGLAVKAADFTVVERSARERPARRDHALVFEHRHPGTPELRERIEVAIAGERVVKAWRTLVVPAEAQRTARARTAWVQGLQTVGFACLSLASLGAIVLVLVRLGRGRIQLGPAGRWTGVVFALLVITNLLQGAVLFELWDPLWPRPVALLKELVEWLVDDLTTMLPLFAFLAAGDSLDREPRGASPAPERAASLWLLGRGKLSEAKVIAASLRGFLVGMICGGALVVSVLLFSSLPGGRVALQPRGFFFYPLNSSLPALTMLCFFAHIALLEELGYRFFAGTWLDHVTGRRWLAIVVPAAVYGLMHTQWDFLPPVDPLWARPLALGIVGCVWGWAFFRYDALTVVLSHFAADLFIFNWPNLASGNPWRIAVAVATIAVPLLPAAIGGAMRLAGVGRPDRPAHASQ